MKNKEIENKDKFETIIPIKKCQNQIPSFNTSCKGNKSNFHIKQNQIGIISTIGIVYFYSENLIYLMNNSNLQLILKEVELTSNDFLRISFEEKIDKIFINSNEDELIVIHYRSNETLIQLYSLEELILKQSIVSKQSIVINKQCRDIQITSMDTYLLLDKDNVLSLFSETGEMVYSFPNKCSLFHQDDSNDITITQLDKTIIIYNKQREIISSSLLTTYSDDIEDYNVLSLYSTNRFIICYLSQEKKSSDDMIVFLELDKENKITNGFIKTEFFYIEEKLNTKTSVFYYTIDASPTILYAINKQAMKLSTFFIFEQKKNKKDSEGYSLFNVDPEDDQVITNYPEDEEQMNCFIGLEVIDFKFKGYDTVKEIISSHEYDTPLLALVLDTKGRLRVYYLRDSRPGEKLREIDDNELFNKDLNKIKDKLITDKSKTITKTSIKMDSKHKDKGESSKGMSIDQIQDKGYRDKLNALRNNFIRRLQFELEIKKEIILDQFNLSELNKEMEDIESKIKNTADCTKLISTLAKESKEYINKRGDINKIIIESRETIDNTKEEIKLLLKKKKEIDDIKSSSTLMSQGIESVSLQNIITSPLFQSFYGINESMTLSKELFSIEQKCISYSKQIEYNKELGLIFQEFQNKIKDINKKVSAYNKKMLYFSKLADTTNQKREFMEVNQNDIFASYLKEFDYYLYGLKKVFASLKKDIEENKNKSKSNHCIVPFNSNNSNKSVYQSQFSIEKRIMKQMTDYSEELAKILINTPCTITYADEEGCKTVEELLCSNANIIESKTNQSHIDKQKDEDAINSLDEIINVIQIEKIKRNELNEKKIKKEEERLLLAKQTEDKYNALNKKLIEYEKEREGNTKNKNEKKENERKEKEEKEGKERQKSKEEENRMNKRSNQWKNELADNMDFKGFNNNNKKKHNNTISDNESFIKDNKINTIANKTESINVSIPNVKVEKVKEKNDENNRAKINDISSNKNQIQKTDESKDLKEVSNIFISTKQESNSFHENQKNINEDQKQSIFLFNEKVITEPTKTQGKGSIFGPQLDKVDIDNTNNTKLNGSNLFPLNGNVFNPNKETTFSNNAQTNTNLFTTQNKDLNIFNSQNSSSIFSTNANATKPQNNIGLFQSNNSNNTASNSQFKLEQPINQPLQGSNINTNNNVINSKPTLSSFNAFDNKTMAQSTAPMNLFGTSPSLGDNVSMNRLVIPNLSNNSFSQSTSNQQTGFSSVSQSNFFSNNNVGNIKSNDTKIDDGHYFN